MGWPSPSIRLRASLKPMAYFPPLISSFRFLFPSFLFGSNGCPVQEVIQRVSIVEPLGPKGIVFIQEIANFNKLDGFVKSPLHPLPC